MIFEIFQYFAEFCRFFFLQDKEYIQDRYIDLLLDSVSGYGNQSREGPAIRPLMRSRSRGGAFAGGQIGVRPRFGDSAFGFDSRAGRGSFLI